MLAATGAGEIVALGESNEGHVNALLLIRWFGTPSQREHFETLATGGALFGVWNTDLPDNPVRMESGILRGAKSFATGVDGLSHAIVTAARPEDRQMLIVPMQGLSVDRGWWKPLGMRASGSHVASFNIPVDPEHILGMPGDYLREPLFSAGIIRCAAVHVGGAHAVFDAALEHMQRTRRANDPHQQHRLGQMATEIAGGYAWLDYAASNWTRIHKVPAATLIACMNAARGAIERIALNVMELAEEV